MMMVGTMEEERFARLNHRDSETSLDPTHFRMYSSSVGRWMTPDPAGRRAANPRRPQSWNRYAYVLNNSVNFADQYGLCNWRQIGTGVVQCVAGIGIVALSLSGEIATGGASTYISVMGAYGGTALAAQGVVNVVGGFTNMNTSAAAGLLNAVGTIPGTVALAGSGGNVALGQAISLATNLGMDGIGIMNGEYAGTALDLGATGVEPQEPNVMVWSPPTVVNVSSTPPDPVSLIWDDTSSQGLAPPDSWFGGSLMISADTPGPFY
jgi:RHS repeat-associated protein